MQTSINAINDINKKEQNNILEKNMIMIKFKIWNIRLIKKYFPIILVCLALVGCTITKNMTSTTNAAIISNDVINTIIDQRLEFKKVTITQIDNQKILNPIFTFPNCVYKVEPGERVFKVQYGDQFLGSSGQIKAFLAPNINYLVTGKLEESKFNFMIMEVNSKKIIASQNSNIDINLEGALHSLSISTLNMGLPKKHKTEINLPSSSINLPPPSINLPPSSINLPPPSIKLPLMDRN